MIFTLSLIDPNKKYILQPKHDLNDKEYNKLIEWLKEKNLNNIYVVSSNLQLQPLPESW